MLPIKVGSRVWGTGKSDTPGSFPLRWMFGTVTSLTVNLASVRWDDGTTDTRYTLDLICLDNKVRRNPPFFAVGC